MTLSSSPSPGVTIRPAFPDDAPALARLAALDSQRLPSGPLLLAEIDGEPWAAIALETARVLADRSGRPPRWSTSCAGARRNW